MFMVKKNTGFHIHLLMAIRKPVRIKCCVGADHSRGELMRNSIFFRYIFSHIWVVMAKVGEYFVFFISRRYYI